MCDIDLFPFIKEDNEKEEFIGLINLLDKVEFMRTKRGIYTKLIRNQSEALTYLKTFSHKTRRKMRLLIRFSLIGIVRKFNLIRDVYVRVPQKRGLNIDLTNFLSEYSELSDQGRFNTPIVTKDFVKYIKEDFTRFLCALVKLRGFIFESKDLSFESRSTTLSKVIKSIDTIESVYGVLTLAKEFGESLKELKTLGNFEGAF